MGIQFPIYRKRLNNKSYYKITSDTTFEEIQNLVLIHILWMKFIQCIWKTN